jgi:hypothetical protein
VIAYEVQKTSTGVWNNFKTLHAKAPTAMRWAHSGFAQN